MTAPTTSTVKTLRAAGPIILVILIVAVAFLGYYQLVYYPTIAPTSSTLTSSTSTGPSEKIVVVTIPSGAQDPNTPPSKTYLPNVVTVYIGYNATVMWVNNDSVPHTVTAKGNTPDPKFDQWGPSSPPYQNLNAGQNTSFTFTVAGTYPYVCSYHNWMSGQVIVKPALSNLTSTTSKAASTNTTVTTAAVIFRGDQSGLLASSFARSLATLTGSGIAPWSVNLFSNLFAAASFIPPDLRKIS